MNVRIGTITSTPQIMPVTHLGMTMDYVITGPPRLSIDLTIDCLGNELPPGSNVHDIFGRLASIIEDALSGRSAPEQLHQKFAEVLGPRRIKA